MGEKMKKITRTWFLTTVALRAEKDKEEE